MTTRPRIGVGMIGYAFMGRAHSAAWRNVAAAFETSWECEWRVTGPSGTAIWDGTRPPVAEVASKSGGPLRSISTSPDPDAPIGIRGALAEFIGSLDSGQPPMGECHDNIKSLAMCVATEQSSATRARVAVEI